MVSTAPDAADDRRLLLIDGSALLYRAHFAFIRNPLRTKQGEVTSAAFGVLTALLPVLDTRRPDRVAFVLDTAAPTFRHRVYPQYKAHRPPTPEELVSQIPRVRELITLLGLPIVEQDGVEADDLIGSLALEAERDGAIVWILSSDKDLFQLVSDHVTVLSPRGRGAELATIDPSAVRERYGVGPTRMIDLLALMGDASDNVPGVPGVGEKTAAQLLQRFESLDRLYERLDQVERPSLREKLRQNEDRARLSRTLVTIRTDLPLDRHWHELERGTPHYGALLDLLDTLEFQSLRRRFAAEAESGASGDLFGEHDSIRDDTRPGSGREAIGVSLAAERPPYGAYQPVTDGAGLESLARELADARHVVAFDTETTGLDPRRDGLVGISIAPEPGRAFYLPVAHAMGPNLDPDRVREALRPFFQSERARRAAQNAKFDWHVLHQFGIPIRDVAFDSMVAAYLIDPDSPKNLDSLAQSRLGWTKIPTEALIGRGRDARSMAALPVDRVAAYACEDADAVVRLVPALTEELQAAGLAGLFEEVEMPLVGVLTRMERAGVCVDGATLAAMSRSLGGMLARLEEEIQSAAGVPFNVNSTRQVAEILFERLKLPPGRRTKEGYSTDVEVLESLVALHPLPGLLLRHRQHQKLKSTYVDALPRLIDPETGRVHATFHQTIASTGRISVSDPSLQNIPIRTEEGRAIRGAFVAEGPDGLLGSFDYSQVELRILAHLSHDPVLLEAFRLGADVHASTAARLFGTSPDEVTPTQRAQAKVVNFGILYGMGATRLARELSMSRSLAAAFIDEYKRTHAGVAAYLESVLRTGRDRGYAETILGRRRPLPALRADHDGARAEAERAAINTPVQGSAADLVKVAMVKIDALLTSQKMRSRLILQVHDELLFESSREEIEALSAIVRDTMEHALVLRVPLVVNEGRGRTWADAHA